MNSLNFQLFFISIFSQKGGVAKRYNLKMCNLDKRENKKKRGIRPKLPQTRQNPQLGNPIRFLTKGSLINEGKSIQNI